MKIILALLALSWFVQHEIDMNNKMFLREVQTLFLATPDDMVRLENADNPAGSPQGTFFRIDGKGKKGYAWVGRVYGCRSGGCSDTPKKAGNADIGAEYFDYFILYDTDARVQSVRVFNYQATHGHGIMSKGWLKQFNGYSGDKKLDPGKNVDAISGATISVRAISADIEQRTLSLRQILQASL